MEHAAEKHQWVKDFRGAVTVCDTEGIILEMNEMAVATFARYGGAALVGSSLLECHPEPARTRLKKLLTTQRSNTYTIEKNGVKKLIHQAPWYRNGQYCGFVEISLEIPHELPHFIRE